MLVETSHPGTVTPSGAASDAAAWALDIPRGQLLLGHGQRAGLWRVTRGAFLIERPTRDGRDVVALALPGDLVGLEALLDEPCAYAVTALLDAAARPETVAGDAALARALGDAVRQQQRQALEMTELRSGAVLARLQHLLRLLGRPGVNRAEDPGRRHLPMLRDIAQIVNSAPETVCRELKHLVPGEPRKARKPAPSRWAAGAAFPPAFAVAC